MTRRPIFRHPDPMTAAVLFGACLGLLAALLAMPGVG